MKPRFSLDRKAPRMRKGEFSKMVITKELYKKFLKEFSEYKDMTWAEFYQNWLDIAERIRYETVYNPLGVKLGSYTGELKLQNLPYKFVAHDHKSSDNVGENIEFPNLQSRGRVVKLKWERRESAKRNKILQFYAFSPTRELHSLAYNYMLDNSDKVRTSRITLGGHPSIWRKKKIK